MRKRYLAAGEGSTKWTLLAACSGPPGPLVQYVKVDLPKGKLDRGSFPDQFLMQVPHFVWSGRGRASICIEKVAGRMAPVASTNLVILCWKRNSPHAQTLVYAKIARAAADCPLGTSLLSSASQEHNRMSNPFFLPRRINSYLTIDDIYVYGHQ